MANYSIKPIVLFAAVVVVVTLGVWLYKSGLITGSAEGVFEANAPLELQSTDGFTISNNAQGKFTSILAADILPDNSIPIGIGIPVSYGKQVAGKRVMVTINARGIPASPSEKIKAMYFTLSSGNSGWQELPLSQDFSDVHFTFDIPPASDEKGDYIAIVPDPFKGVDIRSISVKVLSPKPN